MKCDELKPIDLECNMGKDIKGVEHREPWKAYDIDEVNAAIAELKDENKKLKASSEQIMNELFDKVLIYPHEIVRLEDAYKLAVSLKKTKRELWLSRADRAIMTLEYFTLKCRWFQDYMKVEPPKCDVKMVHKWANIERKCRAKAEEYK